MKTSFINFQYLKRAAALFAVFIVSIGWLMPQAMPAFAQTAPPPYCADGYPADQTQLDECLDYQLSNPDTSLNDPISDAINGPAEGIWGMASAEDPVSKTFLFTASRPTNNPGIMGSINNSADLKVIKSSFRIDQSPSFVGEPQVVFNPKDNRYLVTWRDARRTGGSSGIYGRFVNPDGSFMGNDFAIQDSYNVTPNFDLSYDSVNNRYVVAANTTEFPLLRTITSDATVSEPAQFDLIQNGFEGMVSVTYNPVLNQYWYATAEVTDGDNTDLANGRIAVHRVDASTMKLVGDPIILTSPRLGKNGFAYPQIDYSPIDGATVIMWQEMGRTPGQTSEVYGRTIYNDLSLSNEYPVLTQDTYTASDFYGKPTSMKYNPTTNSFMMATEDGNGGTTYVEIESSGLVLDARECIPLTSKNGNFNPNLGVATGKGFCMASPDYSQAKLASVESSSTLVDTTPTAPYTPPPRDDINTSELSKLISQIYIYALGISGLLAVIMSIFGGYLIMTARGNGAQVAKGKQYLYSALAGMVLLMAAYLILNTINTDLTDFNITSSDNIQ